MSRIEVAVAVPLFHTLSYSCDTEQAGYPVGRRVLVIIGKQKVTGYVLGLQPEEDVDFKILPVLEFLDNKPLFPENMVPFYRWVASYYHFPIGEVIKTALPGGLTQSVNRIIRLGEKAPEEIKEWPVADEQIRPWLLTLLAKGMLSARQSKEILADSTNKKFIKECQNNKYTDISNVKSEQLTAEKHEICFRIIKEIDLSEVSGEEGWRDKKILRNVNAPVVNGKRLSVPMLRTLMIIRELEEKQNQGTVAARDIRKQYSGAAKALKDLERHEIIKSSSRRVYRNPLGETATYYPKPASLSDEQRNVIECLIPALEKKRFHTYLLHGVTGSGKTEVYLRMAAKTLESGRDVLVLVPEIALATQLESHFVSRFGNRVVLLHSGLSRGEKFDQWCLAAKGEGTIVIGARSAVFAPLRSVGLVIVDEEHDSAYKQEDGLRYQGRDLAILRGHMADAMVILGSGTPAISSYAKAVSKKFTLLTMTKRVEDRPFPQVEIVDLKINGARIKGDAIGVKLGREIKKNLEEEKQTILLMNRRGFSSVYLCRDCGEPVKCLHCHVTLTYHKRMGRLICHYCSFSLGANVICGGCKSSDLIPVGFGTERVEQEIREKFPAARVARIDSDTSGNRRKFLATLKSMHNREIDILIGTQMIAKGHDFPGVTLVGAIWADGGLSIPDYRGAEQTYQLLSQVTGRAGRGKYPGKVIIQTLLPEHYAIQFASQHDYYSLYKKEMEIRKTPLFPPYLRLVNLKISGTKETEVRSVAGELAEFCRKAGKGKVEILGPAPSPIDRIRDRYRWQLLLKGSDQADIHHVCSQISRNRPYWVKGDIRMVIDVDPERMI